MTSDVAGLSAVEPAAPLQEAVDAAAAPTATTAAPAEKLNPRIVKNAVLLGFIITATPFALQEIVPYWWGRLTTIGAIAVGIWGMVTYVQKDPTETFVKTLLGAPSAMRRLLYVLLLDVVLCGLLILVLPRPHSPYIRLLIIDANVIARLKNDKEVIRLTIIRKGKSPVYHILQLRDEDKSRGIYLGWPEARFEWIEGAPKEREPALATLSKTVLSALSDPSDPSAWASRWKLARGNFLSVPSGATVLVEIGHQSNGGFTTKERVTCYDGTGTPRNPFEVGEKDAQDAVLVND